ncbi:hypothetical protein [Persephonella sp.]
MEGEDLILKLESLGFDFDTVVLYSESGEIIRVIGDNPDFSEKLPDLCQIVHSVGINLTKVVNKGDYHYTIVEGLEGNILFCGYKTYCLIGIIKENGKPYRYQSAFQ